MQPFDAGFSRLTKDENKEKEAGNGQFKKILSHSDFMLEATCLAPVETRLGDLLDFGQIFKAFGNN